MIGRESNDLSTDSLGRLSQDRSNRRIHAAVGGVTRIHLLDDGGLRSHSLGDLHYFAAGGVDRTPHTGSNPCENRRSVGRAFFSFKNFNFASIHVRLYLPPQGDRAPPPPRRIFRTGTPISANSVKESLKLKATPSRIARTTCPRVWDAVKPIKAARALGSRCGVRSPIK